MQDRPDVFVIGWPGAAGVERRLPAALLQQLGDDFATIHHYDPQQVLSDEPAGRPAMAWLICAADEAVDLLYEVMDRLAAWQCPAMLTRLGDARPIGTVYQGGVVVVPAEAPVDAIALVARSLLSQAELIEQLQRELSITKRHHGGLRGQMDKLDEELRLAARVQQEFLPTKLPKVHDIEVKVMYRPAGYVSGDVYDAARLDEDHIGLWIADVVGHGVPAALMTMFVKAALPTKETTRNGYRIVPPNEALARLNDDMIARSTGTCRFATACYAVLNCRTHTLQVARAGHPLPLILRAEGDIEYLQPQGALLGVFPHEEFDLITAQLGHGDRFMIHSDGFETCFADNGTHDTTRYQTEFAKLGRRCPTDAIAQLEELIDSQPGSLHQVDDLTVVMAGVATVAARLQRADDSKMHAAG